jgi:hypothetical protein
VNIHEFGADLRYRYLGDRLLRRVGRLPSISIPYEAGVEMVRHQAAEARIRLEQGERKALSKNVVVTLPGTCPQAGEQIVICAHHDSVPDSRGANDNAGSVAIMVALLAHFVKHPTRRTLHFIWFGGEEQGFLGSQAYVQAHSKELGNIGMVVNLDGAGRLVDSSYVVILGRSDLKRYVSRLASDLNLGMRVDEGTFGSDNIPFSWHEIPSINITRGSDYNLFVHTKNDEFKWAGADGLAPNGTLAMEIIRRLGDVRRFPFKRGFSRTMQKRLRRFYEGMLLTPEEMPAWCKREVPRR